MQCTMLRAKTYYLKSGRHLADASVWSAIVTMLATLDISMAKDDQGDVINFTPEFTTGITRCSVS